MAPFLQNFHPKICTDFLSNFPFPSELPPKDLYGFDFSPMYVKYSATILPLIDHPNNIKLTEHITSPPYAYSLFSCSLSSVSSII
jgi:hypothetical protein